MTRLVVSCLTPVLLVTCWVHAARPVSMSLAMSMPWWCQLNIPVTIMIARQHAHVLWSLLWWYCIYFVLNGRCFVLYYVVTYCVNFFGTLMYITLHSIQPTSISRHTTDHPITLRIHIKLHNAITYNTHFCTIHWPKTSYLYTHSLRVATRMGFPV